jgi:benzoyl-CoA 2,3-dioxygenase component A
MRRTRIGAKGGDMVLFFGARAPDSLPYFGPLAKVPDQILKKHLVFSRIPGAPRDYVQDRMLVEHKAIAELVGDIRTHIYICGLRAMERGVEDAFARICESRGLIWLDLRDTLRAEGRYHVETW